jgi:hypothetical protein
LKVWRVGGSSLVSPWEGSKGIYLESGREGYLYSGGRVFREKECEGRVHIILSSGVRRYTTIYSATPRYNPFPPSPINCQGSRDFSLNRLYIECSIEQDGETLLWGKSI